MDGTRSALVWVFAGELAAHDLDQIVARWQFCDFAVGHSLLGQEHQRRHDQGRVMVPGRPPRDLIVDRAAVALGILERALHEMPCSLHFRQATQPPAWSQYTLASAISCWRTLHRSDANSLNIW